jgi:hypothetical protein
MSYADIVYILSAASALVFCFLTVTYTLSLYNARRGGRSVIAEPNPEPSDPTSEALQELGWLAFDGGDRKEGKIKFARRSRAKGT